MNSGFPQRRFQSHLCSTSPTFGKLLISEPHSLIYKRFSTLENCMRTKCNNLFKEHSTVPRWNIKLPPTVPMGQIKLKIRSYSWITRFFHLHFRDWNKTVLILRQILLISSWIIIWLEKLISLSWNLSLFFFKLGTENNDKF